MAWNFASPENPRPIRVLYLCEYPSLLGGERSLLQFLDAARIGVQPTVVAPSAGPLQTEISNRAITRWEWPNPGKAAVLQLAGQVKAALIDVVHANSLSTADAAFDLASAFGLPAVAHVRDIARISARRIERLSRLNAVIAVSNAVRESLVGQGLQKELVHSIYNPVDVAQLRANARPGLLRSELRMTAATPLFGCAGQVSLRKGQDLFLDAATLVAIEIPTAQFVIAGQRFGVKQETVDFEENLRDRCMKPPLTGRVHWIGYRPDWPTLVCDLTALVVPSRQEPLSRTLLEAVALGVPAVATDVGGMREILVDRQLGVLVPPDDPAAMAEAMIKLSNTPADGLELDRQPNHAFATRFDPATTVEQMLQLYSDVIANAVN